MNKPNQKDKFIKDNWKRMSDRELASKTGLTIVAVRLRRQRMGILRPPGSPYSTLEKNTKKYSSPQALNERVLNDVKLEKLKSAKLDSDKKYKLLQREIERVSRENNAMLALKNPVSSLNIKKLPGGGQGGEATCIVLASDWHIEERVSKAAVNGKNEYSLAIARKRAEHFFKIALLLRDLEKKNSPVPTMVLALLGDFITGNLHVAHGVPSNCSLEPIEAAVEAKAILKSGIDFLLKESDLKLVIPCHGGNHARITGKSPDSETEMGNSLELFIYSFLAQEFRNNPRVKFLISQAYTSRLQVYDTVFRLHHGHRIRYQGGVGGLDVPANKWILRSNRAWAADYDLFGHHHTEKPSTRFFANGSMIGFNAFAQDSGFEFEEPSQTYLLVHSRFPQKVIDWRSIQFT